MDFKTRAIAWGRKSLSGLRGVNDPLLPLTENVAIADRDGEAVAAASGTQAVTGISGKASTLIRSLERLDFSQAFEVVVGVNPEVVTGVCDKILDLLIAGAGETDFATLNAMRLEKVELETTWDRFLTSAFATSFEKDDIQVFVELAEQAKQAESPMAEAAMHRILAFRRPDFYWPHYRLAVLDFDRGEISAALARLQTVTAQEPTFPWGWFYRAMAEEAALGAENCVASLNKAIELADEGSLSLVVYAFVVLAKMPWTSETASALSRVMSYREFSDADLDRVVAALSKIVLHDPRAVETAALQAALQADIAGALVGAAAVANWWPVHVLLAICAVDARSPMAGTLMRDATLAVRISKSRGRAHDIFAAHIHEPMVRLLRRLAVKPEADWTSDLVGELLDLGEMCLNEFGEGALSEIILELLEPRDLTPAQARRVHNIRIKALDRRGASFEIVSALAMLDPDERDSNTAFLYADIQARLALAGAAGPDLIREIEAILPLVEQPGRVTDQDRARIITILHRASDKAFNLVYEESKERGRAGAGQMEARAWGGYLQRLVAIIGRIESLKHQAAPSGVSRPRLLRPKLVILTSPYIPQVRQYRAEQMAELLDLLDFDHDIRNLNELTPDQARRLCADASIVLFQRQPATPFVLSLMAAMRALGTRILYDIDDLIFDTDHFPPPFSDYEGNIDRATFVHLTFDCALFLEALNFADEIIVSTESLRDRVKDVLRSEKPLYLRRNFVGFEVQLAGARSLTVQRDRPDGTVRLFYGSGTKAHKAYFKNTVVPALVAVLEAYPQARLGLVGHFPELPLFESVMDRIDLLPPSMSFSDFLDVMAQYDINMAPLDISAATDAKSELKWFEAASVGLPSVVSPTRNYCDVLTDGKEVLFAGDKAQWQAALSRLIEDAALRASLVANSRALIEARYTASHWAEQVRQSGMLDTEGNLLLPLAKRGQGKKRLLVVNTYFWPQSIGGATRIAESYVEDLCRRYAEEFDVFVLCANADSDGGANYECETIWCGGALVTQVNVPPRDWADAFDDRIDSVVSEFVRRWRIDVAHLHSIQILTASVARALQNLGVPTLLTLHDGWWLSEHQFLVDDNSRPFLPDANSGEIFRSFTARMSVEDRLRRRKQLRAVLKGCSKVVAVSESFAKVYHHAGFPQVGVHENGVVAMETQVERSRPAGKVRIGFIGGRSEHKGYGLLYRALLKGGLPNIELVVVDHAQPYGYEREGQVGDSRVITLGKFPQSRVEELYSRFDILAAPSIWPESYGLVTREARYAGVPVLVSDCGDISRGIEDGIDGWVIPADDAPALEGLLARLNADPSMADLTPRDPFVVDVARAVDDLVLFLRELAW